MRRGGNWTLVAYRPPPLTVEQSGSSAESVGGAWEPSSVLLGVWAALGALLVAAGLQANLVPDAHLAALAIEHGLLLCSADGDFARFPELRWLNPLSG